MDDNFQKMAVLIDADNTQLSKLEAILHEVSTYGRIVVKKAYGNWKKDMLKNWELELKRLAIKAEQQFDYVTGKNVTDIAMVIGAMDLLFMDKYDAFVLVSSDSDFTPLAIRLRESGQYIIGAGESKTPESFKNACDDFILIELIQSKDDKKIEEEIEKETKEKNINEIVSKDKLSKENTANATTEKVKVDLVANIQEIHNLLKIAYEKYQNEAGFANVSAVGPYIKRVKPDFNSRAYGHAKLPELLAAYPERYEITKYKGKGKVNIVAYRCKG